jgi:hypothetical protein
MEARNMTATALKILDPKLSQGGSGNGISHFRTVWQCARKARLDRIAREGSESGYSATVGIIGHGILDIFYSGDARAEDVPVLQVSDVAHQTAPEEAKRLVSAYLKQFPERDFWGEVVGCEVQLPAPGGEAAVKDHLGLELTARLDLVVRTSLHHADRVYEKTGIRLDPGINIIDHKFKPGGRDGDKVKRPQREKNPQQKYGLSLQFMSYPALWTLLHPDDPCVGMVANIIVGLKEPEFQHAHILPPNENELLALRTWLAVGALLEKSDAPNAAHCYDEKYDYVCPHLTSGACNRT